MRAYARKNTYVNEKKKERKKERKEEKKQKRYIVIIVIIQPTVVVCTYKMQMFPDDFFSAKDTSKYLILKFIYN